MCVSGSNVLSGDRVGCGLLACWSKLPIFWAIRYVAQSTRRVTVRIRRRRCRTGRNAADGASRQFTSPEPSNGTGSNAQAVEIWPYPNSARPPLVHCGDRAPSAATPGASRDFYPSHRRRAKPLRMRDGPQFFKAVIDTRHWRLLPCLWFTLQDVAAVPQSELPAFSHPGSADAQGRRTKFAKISIVREEGTARSLTGGDSCRILIIHTQFLHLVKSVACYA